MPRNRVSVLALLAGGIHDYGRLARPLLRALDGTQPFHGAVVTDPEGLSLRDHQVLLAASDHHLQSGQAAQLTEFVRRGGGLVLLHGTLASWAETGELAELARWAPTGPAPLTELVLQTNPSHPLTQRLGSDLKLTDELYLSEGPPSDAEVILRTSWHFTEQVVAYERGFGAGRFVHIGLGHQASTYEDLYFQKLIHRTLLFAAGQGPPEPGGGGLGRDGALASRDAGSSI